MASNYYTKLGFELKQRQIKNQEAKVRMIGKEVGDEAGPSCDWHDNFGYEDAKRRLEIESALLGKLREDSRGVQIVEIEEQREQVRIGVTVQATLNGKEREITIGAFDESDPSNELISYASPLGRALLGMKAGDSRTVNIAGKPTEIEIIDIRPPSYCYHDLIQKFVSARLSEIGDEAADVH